VLTTVVPEEKGLPHFSKVHIWNITATAAKRAFQVSAYPKATLDDFKIDHVQIYAATAGSISNARRWSLQDNKIVTQDKSVVVAREESGEDDKEIPFGEPK
jgi:hypothetical protein